MLTDSAGGKPARLLLVGADPQAATSIVEMLWAARPSGGLLVTQTAHLADAVQELADHQDSCVLLSLDEGGDSLAPLRELSTASPSAAIIVICEQGSDALGVASLRAGAQDHIVRSELHPARLTRAVEYALERKRAELRLTRQALIDPLTELPNRVLFRDRLSVAVDRSRRTGLAPAVMFLDVDSFKQVNDSLGHAAGDELLRVLAGRFRELLRPMDTVARVGGDEFTFLFEGLSGHEEAVAIAHRIGEAAAGPVALRPGDRETSVTASIGIRMLDEPAIALEQAVGEADAAMYRAKHLGGGRAELFAAVSPLPGRAAPGPVTPERVAPGRVAPEPVTPEPVTPERVAPARVAPARDRSQPPADDRGARSPVDQPDRGEDPELWEMETESVVSLTAVVEREPASASRSSASDTQSETKSESEPEPENERSVDSADGLRAAHEAGELRVHYQPRVSINGQTGLVGFEALVRWEHPEKGLLAPGRFMALAESSGLICEIGDWVIAQALAEVHRWRQSRPGVTISVNVSARQLTDAGFVARVADALDDADADPSVLWLDVPEAAAIGEFAAETGETLEALANLGVSLAVDDFGVGRGSLQSLRELPVDMLKVHESLVAGLESRADDSAVIGAVVELGHALGLSVVAEGVETDFQLAQLRDLGCDGAQGFLFSQPVPGGSVRELLGIA